MSNYSKTTDFEAKDSLPTGDSGKIIRGAEFETEFDAISTAIATKADTAGPTFTGTLTFETISDGTIGVTAFVDEDDMSSDSATLVPTQQSVKAYVDSQVTAQDLDFQADSGGALSIDLDSETLTFTGGTGIDTSGSGNAVTFAIDSTVATLTGTQTLTNKTLTSPDVNTPDIDGGTIDGTVIGGTTPAAVSATTVSATGNITVGGTVDGRDVATDGTKLDGIESGATADQTAAEIRTLVESATDSNVFTDADHTKLDGIEANATADQTDAEIRAAVEAATDSNVFTDADHSKLDGIEASADVTDTANVTAAGAVMDSELTNETAVKALNQGVATTDSPTFAGVTVNGTVEFDGLSGTGAVSVTDILDQDDMSSNSATALATQQSIKAYVDSQVATADTLSEVLANGNTTGGTDVAFGDNDKAIFGAGSDLQIYHDGSNSYIENTAPFMLIESGTIVLRNTAGTEDYAKFNENSDVKLYFDNSQKFATTSTGIDVTGDVTADSAVIDNITIDGNEIDVSSGNLTLDVAGSLKLDADSSNIYLADGGTDIGLLSTNNQDLNIRNLISDKDIYFQGSDGGSTITALTLDMSDAGAATFNYHIKTQTLLQSIGADTQTNVTASQSIGIHLQNTSNTDGNFVPIDFYNSTGFVTGRIGAEFQDAGDRNTDLYFATRANGGGLTERMRIDSDGNVEIKSGGELIANRADNARNIKLFNDNDFGTIQTSNDPIKIASQVYTRFDVGGTERMRIDSSGNVGVGTSSPARQFHVHDASASYLHLTNNTTGSTADDGASISMAGTSLQISNRENGVLQMYTNGSEAMRIDASGNLLVGKTSSGIANSGFEVGQSGQINVTQAGAVVGRFNRKTSDGSILELQKDGTTVGSIGSTSSELGIGGGNANLLFMPNDNAIAPSGTSSGGASDGVLDLGRSARRFKDLYLSGTAYSAALNVDGGSSGIINFGDVTSNYGRLYADSTGTYVGSVTANPLIFRTTNTERARLDTSGNLLVGDTTASAKLWVKNAGSGNTFGARSTYASNVSTIGFFGADRNTTNNTYYYIDCYNYGSSTYRFRVADSGNVTNTNNSYGAISDVKLKENIVDATPKLNKLNEVRIVNYNFIGSDEKQLGVIAQELEQIMPNMVDENVDKDEDGNDLGTTTKTVKYSVFVPMLIKAMQEQTEIINDLRARVAQLEGEN